jgi:hypothetical protein
VTFGVTAARARAVMPAFTGGFGESWLPPGMQRVSAVVVSAA